MCQNTKACPTRAVVLKDSEPDDQDSLQSYMEEGQAKGGTPSAKKSPVYFMYSTVWIDVKGRLNFRKDIYDLDSENIIFRDLKEGDQPPVSDEAFPVLPERRKKRGRLSVGVMTSSA